MAEPALILFDDRTARNWQPFALTRPAGELRFGGMTLRERAERALRIRCIGHLADASLAGFEEPGAPPVVADAGVPADRDVVFLSSRAGLSLGQRIELGSRPALLSVAGQPCGYFAPAGAARPEPEFWNDPTSAAPAELPIHELEGTRLDAVWELVSLSAEQIERDILAAFPQPDLPALPDGVHRLGDAPVVLGREVRIEPGVVLDAREGPIRLDDGARVHAFTKLTGPAWVGRGSTLLGGPITAVSIGPLCKVHGEMEATVVLGYSNKAHDGFLGHAYLGCWVNLGALTTNSDLKNNYGSVRLWTPQGETDTGQMKLGCLLGDHVKTGIGTMLNTGTVIGAGSNVFGSAMPPKYVPPFSWGEGADLTSYDADRFIATARKVMARRDIALTDGQEQLLREAWRRSRPGVEAAAAG